MPTGFIARLHRGFERALLGVPAGSASPTPPLLLVILWAAVCLARIPASFFSLGEDDLWNLVVAVDGPWSRVFFLSGDPFATNHVLYTALSKLLIKASGHHAMELVYRLPALLAGALAMPMAYIAGSRLGGPRAGLIASVLYALAPAFSYHALNARGYMPWSFLVLWALALLTYGPRPDRPAHLSWRLVPVYLLLAISHGLGPVTLGALVVLGPWLGETPPTRRLWFRNLLLAAPALVAGARILQVMSSFQADPNRFPDYYRPVNTWLYPLQWFDANLGSRWLPGLSALWVPSMVWGLLAIAKVNPPRAFLLAGLGWGIPLLFAAMGEQGGYARFALGGMAGWILPIAVGAAALWEREKEKDRERRDPILRPLQGPGTGTGAAGWHAPLAAILSCLVLWAPDLKAHWTLPLQVDYLRPARDQRAAHPGAPALYGISREFATGLSYYCRRNGLDYRVLASAAEAEAALKADPENFALAWIRPQVEIDSSLPPWVENRLRLDRTYPSGELPLEIYRPKGSPPP